MQEIGSHPNHFIRLNQPARADIMWWYLLVEERNGVSLLWDLYRLTEARFGGIHWCLWNIGMWGFHRSYVVPAIVVWQTEPIINCCEGDVLSSTGSCNIWYSVGGEDYSIYGRACSMEAKIGYRCFIQSMFLMQARQVNSQLTAVAPALVSLLSQDITWRCKSWIKLFRDTLQQA